MRRTAGLLLLASLFSCHSDRTEVRDQYERFKTVANKIELSDHQTYWAKTVNTSIDGGWLEAVYDDTMMMVLCEYRPIPVMKGRIMFHCYKDLGTDLVPDMKAEGIAHPGDTPFRRLLQKLHPYEGAVYTPGHLSRATTLEFSGDALTSVDTGFMQRMWAAVNQNKF